MTDSDDDIQLDDDPKKTDKPEKPKSATPLWMAVLVVISFVCLSVVLALQFMEYRYFRGNATSDTDVYADQVLIPPN